MQVYFQYPDYYNANRQMITVTLEKKVLFDRKSVLWFRLFALACHRFDFEAVDSRAGDGGRIIVGVLARMVVVHEAGERSRLSFFRNYMQAAFADDAFVSVGAVALLGEVLQAVFRIHLKRGAAVAGHELELAAFEGTVEMQENLAVAFLNAIIQGQDVGVAVLVIEREAAELRFFHDFDDFGFIGNFAVVSSPWVVLSLPSVR